MKNRIIINNRSHLNDVDAMQYVLTVMEGGKVSETRGIKHYCWATTFIDRVNKELKITVIVNQKRDDKSADSFIIY